MTNASIMHTVETRVLPARPAAAIRETVVMADLGAWMGRVFGEIAAYLGETGGTPAGPPFSRYHSMPGESVDIESGFPVTEAIAPRGRIIATELPAGPAAVTAHMGPYETLDAAYGALQEWIAGHGFRSGGPFWEVYFTDPNEVPDPAQWLTEVFQPLAG